MQNYINRYLEKCKYVQWDCLIAFVSSVEFERLGKKYALLKFIGYDIDLITSIKVSYNDTIYDTKVLSIEKDHEIGFLKLLVNLDIDEKPCERVTVLEYKYKGQLITLDSHLFEIDHELLNSKLSQNIINEYHYNAIPYEKDGYWLCTCGRVNKDKKCSCGNKYEEIIDVDYEKVYCQKLVDEYAKTINPRLTVDEHEDNLNYILRTNGINIVLIEKELKRFKDTYFGNDSKYEKEVKMIQKKQKNTYIVFAVVVVCVALLSAGFLFYNQMRKNQINQIIIDNCETDVFYAEDINAFDADLFTSQKWDKKNVACEITYRAINSKKYLKKLMDSEDVVYSNYLLTVMYAQPDNFELIKEDIKNIEKFNIENVHDKVIIRMMENLDSQTYLTLKEYIGDTKIIGYFEKHLDDANISGRKLNNIFNNAALLEKYTTVTRYEFDFSSSPNSITEVYSGTIQELYSGLQKVKLTGQKFNSILFAKFIVENSSTPLVDYRKFADLGVVSTEPLYDIVVMDTTPFISSIEGDGKLAKFYIDYANTYKEDNERSLVNVYMNIVPSGLLDGMYDETFAERLDELKQYISFIKKNDKNYNDHFNKVYFSNGTVLDVYMKRSYQYTGSSRHKDVYKILVSNGLKCSKACNYTKYYK